MYPILFKIPFLNYPIHSYGLMLVIGLLLAIELGKFLARRSGFRPDDFVNAGILALVSGIIGARVLYVIQFNEEFTLPNVSFWTNVGHAIDITSGGLVYYGGFIFGFVAVISCAIYKKVQVRRSLDIVAPCVMIGLAFGRVGCFLNGCCGGAHCELPWAMSFPYASEAYVTDLNQHPQELLKANNDVIPQDLIGMRTDGTLAPMPTNTPQLRTLAATQHSVPVHPTQIYSFITAGLIALVCYFFFTLNRPAGQGFALMMMLEGPSRAVLELLRVEPTVGGDLTLSMWIGLFVFLVGLALWFTFRRPTQRQTQESAPAGLQFSA